MNKFRFVVEKSIMQLDGAIELIERPNAESNITSSIDPPPMSASATDCAMYRKNNNIVDIEPANRKVIFSTSIKYINSNYFKTTYCLLRNSM